MNHEELKVIYGILSEAKQKPDWDTKTVRTTSPAKAIQATEEGGIVAVDKSGDKKQSSDAGRSAYLSSLVRGKEGKLKPNVSQEGEKTFNVPVPASKVKPSNRTEKKEPVVDVDAIARNKSIDRNAVKHAVKQERSKDPEVAADYAGASKIPGILQRASHLDQAHKILKPWVSALQTAKDKLNTTKAHDVANLINQYQADKLPKLKQPSREEQQAIDDDKALDKQATDAAQKELDAHNEKVATLRQARQHNPVAGHLANLVHQKLPRGENREKATLVPVSKRGSEDYVRAYGDNVSDNSNKETMVSERPSVQSTEAPIKKWKPEEGHPYLGINPRRGSGAGEATANAARRTKEIADINKANPSNKEIVKTRLEVMKNRASSRPDPDMEQAIEKITKKKGNK
jgi:hypothetical protein